MHYDERFAKIINQILKTGHGVWALINRNPTISESSILYVRIRKIHRDPDDYTMHLAPDILTLLAADFDRLHCPSLQECGVWNRLNCWDGLNADHTLTGYESRNKLIG